MRHRRLFSLVAPMLILTACATNGSTGGATTSAEADPNGTVTIAVGKAVGDLDPQKTKAIWAVQNLIFEPLVTYGEGGKIGPGLADKWDTSPDGRTYTFHLREGVTFSDGTPWDSTAAKFNLQRWVGVKRMNWLTASRLVTSMQTPDAHTLTMTLSKAYPEFLTELSLTRPVRFLSPKAVTGDQTVNPIGTGPFVVESNTTSETVLKRNPKYWGGPAKIATVNVKVIPDSQARLTALRNGTVDIIGGSYSSAPLAPSDVALVSSAGTVLKGGGDQTIVMSFNDAAGRVTADKAVRRAIGMAIDRPSMAKALYAGLAKEAGSLFPETVPNSAARPAPPRDVEGAKKLLDSAGWTGSPIRQKGGQPLKATFVFSEEALPGARSMAEAIQSQLKEVGIEVSLQSVDHATAHEVIPGRQYDLAILPTYGAPYDPGNTLRSLFQSDVDSGVDGKIFVGGPPLDALIKAAASAKPEQQGAAYQKVYAWLDDNAACVPLLVPDRVWVVSKRVQGAKLAPTEYEFPITGASVGA